MRALTSELNALGVQTIALDFFGRGHSSAAFTPHNNDFYVSQVADLLDALSVTEPVHFVALSMGGAVAVRCVATARSVAAQRRSL